MLNTAIWTSHTPIATILEMPTLVENFEVTDQLPIAKATGLTHSALPEKLYVYGTHAQNAEHIRNRWNQLHPSNPMP